MRLRGATALVTGGSRGVGRALAHELSRRGAHLALVARGSDELRRVADEVGAVPLIGDLSNPASVDRLAEEAEEALGRVDLLINNAALVGPAPVREMSDSDLRDQMECNLVAPMRLVRRLLPGMLDRRLGHIVNISSGAAALPLANMTNYCAAKAGLLHYTASLRSEVSRLGVGTTVVELGTVSGTQAYEAALTDERLSHLYGHLKRLRLMSDTSAEKVAARVARAVESNKPHVRLPPGAYLAWALNSAVRDATHYVFRADPEVS